MRVLGDPPLGWGYLGNETGSDSVMQDAESNVTLPETSSTLTIEE